MMALPNLTILAVLGIENPQGFIVFKYQISEAAF